LKGRALRGLGATRGVDGVVEPASVDLGRLSCLAGGFDDVLVVVGDVGEIRGVDLVFGCLG